MKVLHILSELKHSGAEVMLQQSYEIFEKHGIESHILSTGTNVGDYAAVLQRTGYKIHHIPFRKHPAFFIAVRKLVSLEKFAVVHLHVETAFIWYVLLLNMSNVRTVVKTYHSVFQFTGYLRWKRALHRKISTKVFGTIQHAIGDSVLKFEKERFGNDCILIRNWTDTKKFRPPSKEERDEARSRYSLKPSDFAIVIVGACTEVKNHTVVFSAVKKANSVLGTQRIMIVHVGSGPLLEEECSYAKRNGVYSNCRFIGTMDDVRPCVYAADAFVMTSHYEGLGNAALEAMSVGLPAILYDVYGLRDLLQHGDGGVLIDPREDALTEALLLLANNRELTAKKGREARQTILKNYSLENSVRELIQVYTVR